MINDLREDIKDLRAILEEARSLGLKEHETIPEMLREAGKVIGMYPLPNLAIDVCTRAITMVKEEEEREKVTRSPEATLHICRIAYCSVLPSLYDRENIRDFIACVVHGMGIGIIPTTEGTRLLYGAQIALSALPSPRSHKKRNKNDQKPPVPQPQVPIPSTS